LVKKHLFIFFLWLSIVFTASGQKGFVYNSSKSKYIDVKFQFINNIIILPVSVNGSTLNFILDSGVNKTIVFNSSKAKHVFSKQVEIKKLQGLGSGEPIEAILSKNNRLSVGNYVSYNHSIYVTLEDEFDFSSKMGETIHGVIGFEFFKNALIYIDFIKKKIRIYNPEFKLKKCKKCEDFDLTFYNNKPFVKASVGLDESSKNIPVNMLIDSGGSDALWLFEYSLPELTPPKDYFDDFLGVGLSGTIFGKRSRINSLQLGKFLIKKPTATFLDSISTKNARSYVERNGSIGNNILKRFKVWIDYKNKTIRLKKAGSFSSGFNYNMTGLEVVYDGKILVKEKEQTVISSFKGQQQTDGNDRNTINFVTNYTYKFKPNFKINEVVKGSPGDVAGVRPNDVLLKINGKNVYNFTLNQIIAKFQEKNNKKIRLLLSRGGKEITVEFRLKMII